MIFIRICYRLFISHGLSFKWAWYQFMYQHASADDQPLHQPIFELVSIWNSGDPVFSAIHQRPISSQSAMDELHAAASQSMYQLNISSESATNSLLPQVILPISLLSVCYEHQKCSISVPSASYQGCNELFISVNHMHLL
jgi:hypothetical protein